MSIKTKGNIKIQIYATDIDKEAIDAARTGTYPVNVATGCLQGRLQRIHKRRQRLSA